MTNVAPTLSITKEDGMTSLQTADGLRQQAEQAEERADYAEAHRLWILAAEQFDSVPDEETANLCFARAIRCFENTEEEWLSPRLWDFIGDRLVDQVATVHSPVMNDAGQAGIHNLVRHWTNPGLGYYRADEAPAKKRHQAAWSYMWAAESLDKSRRRVDAAVRWRKAAIAWELSQWSEQDRENATNTNGNRWKKDRFYGEKWKLAAECYFRAAYDRIGSTVADVFVADVFMRYAPEEVFFVGDHGKSDHPVMKRAHDIERLVRCWATYGSQTGSVAEALDNARQHLSILQNRLAQEGRRKEAACLYQQKQRIALSAAAHRKSPSYPFKWMYWKATASGSSILRTLIAVAVFYLVLFPLFFLAGGWIEHASDPASAVSLGEATLFSMGNVVSMPVLDYEPRGMGGAILQVMQGWSAYFVLGFSAWVLLRSFED
jgi:hypothetical protein